MRLKTTHGAWDAPPALFHGWRTELARAAGYEIAGMVWEPNPDLPVEFAKGETDRIPADPLVLLLEHSDCDGEIRPIPAIYLAGRLEQLLSFVGETDNLGMYDGFAVDAAQRFIAGLRAAAAADEPMLFNLYD